MDNTFPSYNVYNKGSTYPIVYRKNNVTKADFLNINIRVSDNGGFEFKIVDCFPSKELPKIFKTKAQLNDYIKKATMNNWEN